MRPARYRDFSAAQDLAAILLFVSASVLIAPNSASAAPMAQSSDPPSAHPEQALGPHEADTKIATLVTQIENALEAGHLTSPDGINAAVYLSDALSLVPLASPQGAGTMRDLPATLQQRAQQEYTQGHWQAGANFEAFAQVLSSMAAHDNSSHVMSGSAGTTDSVHTIATNGSPLTPAVPTQALRVAAKPAAIAPVPTTPPAASAPPVSPPATQLGSAGPPVESSQPASEPPHVQVAMIKPLAATPQPESTETKTVPPPAIQNPALVGELMQRGDALIALGDISGARRLYALAAQYNSGDAALKLGDTYTPDFLVRHGVEGLQPDMQKAHVWYDRAAALGATDAQSRITSLARLQ